MCFLLMHMQFGFHIKAAVCKTNPVHNDVFVTDNVPMKTSFKKINFINPFFLSAIYGFLPKTLWDTTLVCTMTAEFL